MFQGFSGATVDFMWGIRFNNEKGWFEAHKEEYLTTFQRPMKALADEVYGAFTDRHPDLDLICKVSPHLPGRPAALRPRPLQGPSVAEPDPPPRGGLRRAGVLVRAGPGGLLLRHGLLAGSGRHHGQVPRPHGPGAQGHGKAGPPLPEAGRICAGGGGLQAPQGRPSRLLTPWYSKKSFALSHDAPHGEPLWSHDLVDLLLEGYEFLLPYYEYMLSLSGDPDPRAQ